MPGTRSAARDILVVRSALFTKNIHSNGERVEQKANKHDSSVISRKAHKMHRKHRALNDERT